MSFFRSRYFIFAAIVLLSAASLMLLTSKQVSSQSTDDKVVEAAEYAGEDWMLTSLNNQQLRLSDYKDQPVLLVFWATWCPYCKKLLPGIQSLHEKYASRGLKIIAVNIREDWKPDVYWRNHEYTFDSVLEGDEVAIKYGVKGTPGIVFIQPGGKVLGVQSFSDPQHPMLEKFAQMYTSKK